MQERRVAYIIPLDLLFSAPVDPAPIVSFLNQKATEEAKEEGRVFSPATAEKDFYQLYHYLSMGLVSSLDGFSRILKVFQLTKLSLKELTIAWNKVLDIGSIDEESLLLCLRGLEKHSKIALSFYSITDAMHLDKMVQDYRCQEVSFDPHPENTRFLNFRLYPSFRLNKDELELIKHAVAHYRAQHFPQQKIVVALRDLATIEDKLLRQKAEVQQIKIKDWCLQNKVDWKVVSFNHLDLSSRARRNHIARPC